MRIVFLILCGLCAGAEAVFLMVGYLRALKGREPLSRSGLWNGILIGLFLIFWILWNGFRVFM